MAQGTTPVGKGTPDSINAIIAALHQMLGHDKAAAVLGVDPWPGPVCLLCQREKGTPADLIGKARPE